MLDRGTGEFAVGIEKFAFVAWAWRVGRHTQRAVLDALGNISLPATQSTRVPVVDGEQKPFQRFDDSTFEVECLPKNRSSGAKSAERLFLYFDRGTRKAAVAACPGRRDDYSGVAPLRALVFRPLF